MPFVCKIFTCEWLPNLGTTKNKFHRSKKSIRDVENLWDFASNYVTIFKHNLIYCLKSWRSQIIIALRLPLYDLCQSNSSIFDKMDSRTNIFKVPMIVLLSKILNNKQLLPCLPNRNKKKVSVKKLDKNFF